MRKDLINYMDSIGELELTMSPSQVETYKARQTLQRGMPRLIRKWRVHRLFAKVSTVVAKIFHGYRVREAIEWVHKKPLSLGENPCFNFLKEQKYLIKHILLK